jgi:hypothetical protein
VTCSRYAKSISAISLEDNETGEWSLSVGIPKQLPIPANTVSMRAPSPNNTKGVEHI